MGKRKSGSYKELVYLVSRKGCLARVQSETMWGAVFRGKEVASGNSQVERGKGGGALQASAPNHFWDATLLQTNKYMKTEQLRGQTYKSNAAG